MSVTSQSEGHAFDIFPTQAHAEDHQISFADKKGRIYKLCRRLKSYVFNIDSQQILESTDESNPDRLLLDEALIKAEELCNQVNNYFTQRAETTDAALQFR